MIKKSSRWKATGKVLRFFDCSFVVVVLFCLFFVVVVVVVFARVFLRVP